jgi:hypothetical protein
MHVVSWGEQHDLHVLPSHQASLLILWYRVSLNIYCDVSDFFLNAKLDVCYIKGQSGARSSCLHRVQSGQTLCKRDLRAPGCLLNATDIQLGISLLRFG